MNVPKKIFVSYKYSDVVEGRETTFNFRDQLINLLGDRGFKHKGENGESHDLSSYTDQQIEQKIAPDIKNSSITIVLITPNACKSEWIPWEVSLSLRERVYDNEADKTRNGIIGVYLPLDANNYPYESGSYNYYMRQNICGTTMISTTMLPLIIKDNCFNLKIGGHTCKLGCCQNVYDSENGSYIQLLRWHDFILNMDKYIELAWSRREKFDDYNCRINLKEGK